MQQEVRTEQPVMKRAEEVLDRAGHNIGFFAMRTSQRVQQTVVSLRRGPGQQGPSAPRAEGEATPSPEEQPEQARSVTMQRAEEMVERVGGTFGLLTSVAGIRIQRATARMREEAEDMWAEAQSLRGHEGHSREQYTTQE